MLLLGGLDPSSLLFDFSGRACPVVPFISFILAASNNSLSFYFTPLILFLESKASDPLPTNETKDEVKTYQVIYSAADFK